MRLLVRSTRVFTEFPRVIIVKSSALQVCFVSGVFRHQSPTTKGFFLFQGMHELLAPIVYVLHEDARSFQHLEGSSL